MNDETAEAPITRYEPPLSTKVQKYSKAGALVCMAVFALTLAYHEVNW